MPSTQNDIQPLPAADDDEPILPPTDIETSEQTTTSTYNDVSDSAGYPMPYYPGPSSPRNGYPEPNSSDAYPLPSYPGALSPPVTVVTVRSPASATDSNDQGGFSPANRVTSYPLPAYPGPSSPKASVYAAYNPSGIYNTNDNNTTNTTNATNNYPTQPVETASLAYVPSAPAPAPAPVATFSDPPRRPRVSAQRLDDGAMTSGPVYDFTENPYYRLLNRPLRSRPSQRTSSRLRIRKPTAPTFDELFPM